MRLCKKKRGASGANEPSEDQLSAVHQLIEANLVPYVDFAFWGANNKSFQDRAKYRASRFDAPTQTWQQTELPGPKNLEDWRKSWRVYETALLMLDAVSPEHLQSYVDFIYALAQEQEEDYWFIIYQADVVMRQDHFERIRRQALFDYESLDQEGKNKSVFQP